jgi:hypothetical protein
MDILANKESSLDITLQRALTTLRDSGINTLGAGPVLSGDDPPIGRIFLYDSKDKEHAARILVSFEFQVLSK